MRSFFYGALAGLAATMAMTSFMQRAHAKLPPGQRYPLPPREILDRTAGVERENAARTATMFSHFGFGALAGSLFALPAVSRLGGVPYGLGVWGASYLGWLPASRILAPAIRHPGRRNLLMLAAHVVWGAVLARSFEELNAAERAFGREAGEGKLPAERREMEERP